jgi:predicted enzyme related to lactoylglutathione lyase
VPRSPWGFPAYSIAKRFGIVLIVVELIPVVSVTVMPRVVHFEIYGEKPEALVSFYEQVFAWKFERWGPMEYWIIRTGDGPGIDGGLGRQRNPGVITIDVPDVDAYLAKVQAAGGAVVVPKTTMPGVGYLAYFEDPQGNVFGIMQDDPQAR